MEATRDPIVQRIVIEGDELQALMHNPGGGKYIRK